MDYCFGLNERAPDAARRVAREQLERAIAELSEQEAADGDEQIHAVRKRLKKLRALVRLIRPGGPDAAFDRTNQALRDLGRQLSTARRAAAVVGCFDALVAHFPGEIDTESSATLRELLLRRREHANRELRGEGHHAEVAALLAEQLAGVDAWPLEREGWRAIGPGVRRVYAASRAAFHTALREPTTENLHEWRKQAKHHFYHTRLLRELWPPVLAAMEEALDELTEQLGAEHDLDDLRLALHEQPLDASRAPALQTVVRQIELRRAELRQAAFTAGARLFAERPRAFSRRLRAYWRAAEAGRSGRGQAPPPAATRPPPAPR